MTSFQTLYRLVVMAGTVVVVTMAWRVYGPPADQLQPLIHRARHAMSELLAPSPADQHAEGHRPQPFDAAGESLVPLAENQRQFDPAFEAAAWNEAPPLVPGALPPPTSESLADESATDGPGAVAAVAERLRQLGVEDYSLSPWGTSSGLYRFRCSAPWGAGGAYHRHFEAISASPADAAQRVLADIERWQSSQATSTASQIR